MQTQTIKTIVLPNDLESLRNLRQSFVAINNSIIQVESEDEKRVIQPKHPIFFKSGLIIVFDDNYPLTDEDVKKYTSNTISYIENKSAKRLDQNIYFCDSQDQLEMLLASSKAQDIHQTCQYSSQEKVKIMIRHYLEDFSIYKDRMEETLVKTVDMVFTKRGVVSMKDRKIILNDQTLCYREVLDACRNQCLDVSIRGSIKPSSAYVKKQLTN